MNDIQASTLTLEQLNACPELQFARLLGGIYEHSPWIPERAAACRPFLSLETLKLALQQAVSAATREEQLALVRAHPELAGKAAIAGKLTRESTGEQAQAGLHQCTPEEFATLQRLNAQYNARFGFPFILAVKGPTGKGLARQEIIAAFGRRLKNRPDDELAENLRQVHRIAELRLNDLLGHVPALGLAVMEWAEEIGQWSDDGDGLTCAYMTMAHRKTAVQLATWMRESGMEVGIDAVGNVVGRYLSPDPQAKTLMTGSHYDTVHNGGRYDGRAGILLPIAIVRHLHARGERLPYHLEIVGFSEEEGVRYKSTFLGSNAVSGRFDMDLLDKTDAEGITMRAALLDAGHDVDAIAAIARDPGDLLGFVEIHIEQGPVLLERNLPVGVVTSIAGSRRYLIELEGVASHAGTTPMSMRKDAAAAAAEIVLFVERRCNAGGSLVGTVGQLQVPQGSVNVIPGSCRLSLDVRAADDAARDAAADDILREIDAICARRNIESRIELLLSAPAVPCSPRLMRQLAGATARAGVPPFELTSGAGHDAMSMAAITDVAMLFTRCGNGGISHNPLETMTADDADVAARIFLDFLRGFAP
ncbi:allantoate amidohydrolase [Noviherbaspirillum galbum]|uniref:Allantoate amidohydrolase n=1 Tax=Noviherbaspirillum galbum TaxID=2709383 RepID=A0A6B3SUB4_9BURK|nr:allantoate amidohydrolase [Noviherbaspirillum galbum]NEX64393.1 allantoate amidohydrolase [Noviherbaspirillum galbum]